MKPVRIVQLADLHIGRLAEPAYLEAIERQLPELNPDVVVLAGDLSQRARHGELIAARSFVRHLAQTCQPFILPGNHDVQWWWRPFVPFGSGAKYKKYRRYLGGVLAPTLKLPGVVIASVLTSYGLAWGSLTPRLRDIAVKGHLPGAEIRRVRQVFAGSGTVTAKILVVHHNVLRGKLSRRMGLARWRQAQRRIVQAGTHLVLCGHDHQEGVGTIQGKVVVSTTGTVSTGMRGGRPAVFNVVDVASDRFSIAFYRWEAESGAFQKAESHAFARHVIHEETGSDEPAAVYG